MKISGKILYTFYVSCNLNGEEYFSSFGVVIPNKVNFLAFDNNAIIRSNTCIIHFHFKIW